MNFTTPIFLFFFGIVFIIRWCLAGISSEQPKNTYLLIFLTLSSYLFYMSWSVYFVFLILLTTLYDFYLSQKIYTSKSAHQKKLFLSTSIVFNLSLLGFFKYYYFLSGNFQNLFNLIGMPGIIPVLKIALPAGISFYTFQSISYTVDVYRNQILPEKNLLRYMFYLSFFPQLVAGPIVVAKYFLPQINKLSKLTLEDIQLKEGLYYLISGFIKKAVLADSISEISDLVFRHPEHYSYSALCIGVFSYSIQIYCDFSGYTDIARGLAILLGFHLPENFNMPYIASSFKDFWKRWHITLSSWLQNYLYIPMGGNRKRETLNLILTMLIGGLWHGASWNFVIWGGLHGTALVIERYAKKIIDKTFMKNIKNNVVIYKLFQFAYTIFIFLMVSTFWIFFRSESIEKSWIILKGIYTWQSGVGLFYFQKKVFAGIAAFLLVFHWIGNRYRIQIQNYLSSSLKYRDVVSFTILTMAIVLLSKNTKPFIYFVF